MIGPTGSAKRRLRGGWLSFPRMPLSSRSKRQIYYEVGYVGRDVDSIIRDLVGIGNPSKSRERETQKMRARAEDHAEERILDVLLPAAREIGAPIEVRKAKALPGRNSARNYARGS